MMSYNVDTGEVMQSDNPTALTTYLNNSILLVPKLFQDQTITSSQTFIDVFEELRNEYESALGEEIKDPKLTNWIQRELFSSIASRFFTSSQGLNLKKDSATRMFYGANSLANLVHKVQTHPDYKQFQDNPFLKALQVEFSDDVNNKPNFITLVSTRHSNKWSKEALVAGWEDLIESDNEVVSKMARGLIGYSAFSTGMQQSFIGFHQYIPPRILRQIVNNEGDIVSYSDYLLGMKDMFNSEEATLLTESIIDEIYQHNYHLLTSEVRNLKEFITAKTSQAEYPILGVINNIYQVKNLDNTFKRYITYKYTDQDVSNSQVEVVMKYLGYSSEYRLPIYYSVPKKGFSQKARKIKEYGYEGSIVPGNDLGRYYSREQALNQATKKYGPIIESRDFVVIEEQLASREKNDEANEVVKREKDC
jgi:hypothetical protein